MFGTKPNRDFLMLEVYNKDKFQIFLTAKYGNFNVCQFPEFIRLKIQKFLRSDFYNKEKIHILPNIETLTFANFQILQNTK